MVLRYIKYCYALLFTLFANCYCIAQITVPWSSSLNVTFGRGLTDPGPPLSTGKTTLIYSNQICPAPGHYSIISREECLGLDTQKIDAGHIFFAGGQFNADSGYMMMATLTPNLLPQTVFEDTVNNLCSNTDYLFWAGIVKADTATCMYPNFTFSVETAIGQIIQTFQTGDIGGSTDKFAWYPGYWFANHPPPFPYYGGNFTMPAGVSNVVLKIIANPSAADATCSYTFLLDNILLTPAGPGIHIITTGNPDAWLTNTCLVDSNPLVLKGSVDKGYLLFGTQNYKNTSYVNPAFQWQQSSDNGFTWADIPGETNLDLSRHFSVPGFFFLRVRGSDGANINNQNCSVVSNIIEVEVNGIPDSLEISSNSPVCTNGDLIFTLKGGASYTMTGPNGFYDNSASPHIYNPKLADSGWYYAQVTSAGGCSINDSTYVMVNGPNVQVGAGQSICYGKTIQLQASGGSSYSWSPASGLSNPGIANPLATPIATTTYTVTVTDGSGCSNTGTVTINLPAIKLIAAISGPDVVCPADVAVFRDSSQGAIVSWNWDFDNGQVSTQSNPLPQAYPQTNNSTNYTVRLIVNDTSRCADTTYKIIQAINNCNVAVPSAFTPNGDGINDYLYPLNAYKATNLVFSIYNRYGQLVFETKDWTKKWDGTFKGNRLPSGTFIWILEYTDANNKRQSYRGTSVLIR